MADTNITRIYCVLARWPADSVNCAMDFLIGEFNDGSYHVLGCRPPHLAYLLTDEMQSKDDWGTLLMLKGSLEDVCRKGTLLKLQKRGLEETSHHQIELQKIKYSFIPGSGSLIL